MYSLFMIVVIFLFLWFLFHGIPAKIAEVRERNNIYDLLGIIFIVVKRFFIAWFFMMVLSMCIDVMLRNV